MGGETETQHDALLARKRIGPYRIEGLLGRGSMGIVCRATDASGRWVALKMLANTVLATKELVRRFQREAQIRIEHPNVIRVIDADTTDEGISYIAFELLEGETIEAWYGRQQPSPAEVLDLGVQVCRGLTAAHSRGIIHRDLKPANLFRCKDGTVKILDFGIAFAQAHDSRLTTLGAIVGTPWYLSPEQAGGQLDIDGRTDLWALGAVLYEGLAGRPPFARDTPLATVVAVVREEPAALPCPPALAATVRRALVKAREGRWQTAADFEAALAGIDLAAEEQGPSLGSTPSMGPEENRVVAILLAEGAQDLPSIESAVRREGGILLPLLGQRALGVFGGEHWAGDEGPSAVRAGLECRRGARWMAVASGRARRSDAGITGAVLSAAERGCDAQREGLVVDGEIRRQLPGDYELLGLGDDRWEVTGTGTGEPSSATDRDSRVAILGRQAEIAQMAASIRTVLEEERSVVVQVVGPPGIGKTRLRRELERMLPEASGQLVVLSARAAPNQRDVGLSLMAAALRNRARTCRLTRGWPDLSGSAQVDDRRAAVRALVAEARLSPAVAADTELFLGVLLDVPMPDSVVLDAARRDPQLMLDRLGVALRDYFEGLCAQSPVALVLEDLQWADPSSMERIEELADRLAARPLLVFVTARPELLETRPDWIGGRDVVRIEPRGLVVSDVATLATTVAGRSLAPPLVRAIAERTGGNPLFVEHIVLDIVDRGDVGAQDSLPLPLTVEAAVQGRLDGLPPEEKELCKRAAVLGRPFTPEELEALGVVGAVSVLASLGRRDLLSSRARSQGARAYQFRSALVAEVAARMLADEIRAELHRRAARYLALAPDPDSEEIAGHHERGGEGRAAAERYAEATLAAWRRGDALTVLRCSERAIGLGLPVGARFSQHMVRHDVLRFLARRDEQGREVLAAVMCAGNDRDRARALAEKAAWLTGTGRARDGVAAAREAVHFARRSSDGDVLVRALVQSACALMGVGELDPAREAVVEAEELSRGSAPEVRAFVMEWRAQVHGASGEIGERMSAFREAVELYRLAGDIRRAAGAECNLADACNRVGAYGEADHALIAALEGCRRVGNRLMEGYALLNRGYALSRLGRIEEASSTLDEALAIAGATGDARLTVAARVYAARAKPPPVAASMEEDAATAERLGMPAIAAAALVVAARVRMASGETQAAAELSGRALAIRDRHDGLEEEETDVFLAHAEALEATGRQTEARALLERGRQRVSQIAGGIAEGLWRRSFLASVPATLRPDEGG